MNYNKIVICGMYRSGSTLLFNIMKALCEEYAIPLTCHKVHLDWTNKLMDKKWAFIKESYESKNLVLYSRRDIRDVICSYCVREQSHIDEFRHSGKGYLKFLEWVVSNDYLINGEVLRAPNINIINYEREIAKDSSLLSLCIKLASLINVDLKNPTTFSEKFKFSTTKLKCDSLSEMEGHTQYWPRHLGDGAVGKYRSLLAENHLKSIEENALLNKWLKDFYP